LAFHLNNIKLISKIVSVIGTSVKYSKLSSPLQSLTFANGLFYVKNLPKRYTFSIFPLALNFLKGIVIL